MGGAALGFRGGPATATPSLVEVMSDLAAAPGWNLARAAEAVLQADDPAERKPDIIFVLTDDQDAASLTARARLNGEWRPVMKNLMARRGGGWTNFQRAYTNHAICAPARATLLTGLYSHHHGVEKNGWIKRMDANRALPKWLHDAGYHCIFRGKYSYGKNDGSIPRPPGWDVWQPGGGYSDAVFPQAIDYIQDAIRDNPEQPIFACIWPVDPHIAARVPPRYKDVEIELPADAPSLNEADMSDKPAHIRKLPLLSRSKLNSLKAERRRAARALMAVDDGIGAVMDTLEAAGRLDNAIIVFAGDHGFLWGEHRLERKDSPYWEAARFPLLIRDPRVSGNRDEVRLVSNCDVAATLADLAGVGAPATDGASLMPMMRGLPDNREEVVLIQKRTATGRDDHTFAGVYAVLGDGREYAYVEHDTGEMELYDLAVDPWQLHSVHNFPEYAARKSQLRALLDERRGA